MNIPQYIIWTLDIVAMLGTIICLSLTSKSHKAWLWYLVPTLSFIVLMAIKGVPCQLIMGLFLFGIGLKNYLIGRRKQNEGKSKTPRHTIN